MNSKKIAAIALAAVAMGTMAAFAACGGNDSSGSSAGTNSSNGSAGGTELTGSLNITGSSSVFPLMGVLADDYMATHSGVKITVTSSDSGTGIADAQNGLNDFGMASRALKSTETGVVSKQIATDGIAIVVKPDSAVESVTSQELYDLYANGTPIQTVITAGITRESGSGTRDAFGELIKDASGATLKALPTLASVISQQNSTDGVKTEIAKNASLVGYISLGSLDDTVKALKFNGVAATVENINNDTYKLYRPFNIVYQSEEKLSELAEAFIAYIMSAEGQATVEAEGYIKVA